MTHLFRPNRATQKQVDRLRELATWPGMPAEAEAWTEEQIGEDSEGRHTITMPDAQSLIAQLGRRIRKMDGEE